MSTYKNKQSELYEPGGSSSPSRFFFEENRVKKKGGFPPPRYQIWNFIFFVSVYIIRYKKRKIDMPNSRKITMGRRANFVARADKFCCPSL